MAPRKGQAVIKRPPSHTEKVDGKIVRLFHLVCTCGEEFQHVNWYLKLKPSHYKCRAESARRAVVTRREKAGKLPPTGRVCKVCQQPVGHHRGASATCSERCALVTAASGKLCDEPEYPAAFAAYAARVAWCRRERYPAPEDQVQWIREQIQEMRLAAKYPARVADAEAVPGWSKGRYEVYESPREI